MPCSRGANTEPVCTTDTSGPNVTLHMHVLSRGQGGITEGLVKGALSVAASAYKALFTGPNCSVQVGSSQRHELLLQEGILVQLTQGLLPGSHGGVGQTVRKSKSSTTHASLAERAAR